jgi:hypothetical protein
LTDAILCLMNIMLMQLFGEHFMPSVIWKI